MILLIAGASHTGKTVLAQRLLEKYNYPYLSIDLLKMGLIRSGQCALSPESDDAELTRYLWPIGREMMKFKPAAASRIMRFSLEFRSVSARFV